MVLLHRLYFMCIGKKVLVFAGKYSNLILRFVLCEKGIPPAKTPKKACGSLVLHVVARKGKELWQRKIKKGLRAGGVIGKGRKRFPPAPAGPFHTKTLLLGHGNAQTRLPLLVCPSEMADENPGYRLGAALPGKKHRSPLAKLQKTRRRASWRAPFSLENHEAYSFTNLPTAVPASPVRRR